MGTVLLCIREDVCCYNCKLLFDFQVVQMPMLSFRYFTAAYGAVQTYALQQLGPVRSVIAPVTHVTASMVILLLPALAASGTREHSKTSSYCRGNATNSAQAAIAAVRLFLCATEDLFDIFVSSAF